MADIVATPGSERPPGDERRFRNEASAATGWLGQEARWAGGVFLKLAATIMLTRAVSRFFGFSIPRLQERAADLTDFGRRRKPYSDPKGGGGSSPASSGFGASAPGGSAAYARKSEAPPFTARNGERARFVQEVGGLKIWHHAELRDGWLWPCPITSPQACQDCHWLVATNGTAYCTPTEKLRQILSGRDDGADLYELRERIVRGR